MSSNEIAIRVKNIDKCYQIYNTPRDRLMQFILPRFQKTIGQVPKQYFQEFWALRNISFDIMKGETVGIIGRNGSGKSTLLQLICGILTPTSGLIETNGRVAALLELGAGFNPEFSGRDNVYMSAGLLGLSRKEIDNLYEDIVAFSGIGNFIDQPVKTYSSGMFVRLAFSVNIMSHPEIMIVDEALAVGDMNFQARCITALKRIQDDGATVLFVSHDIGTVKSLCSHAICLDGGEIKKMGKATIVAEYYDRVMREEMNQELKQIRVTSLSDNKTISKIEKIDNELEFKKPEEFTEKVNTFRYGSGEALVTFVELLDTNNNTLNTINFNQKVKIHIYFESTSQKTISVNYNIFDDKKINVTGSGFLHTDQPLIEIFPKEKYLIEYTTRLPLQEGNYSLRIQITSPITIDETAEFIDVIEDAIVFNVARWDKARVWSKVHLFPDLKVTKIS